MPVLHFTGVILGQDSEVCTSKAPGALWATLNEPTILFSHQIQAVGKSSSPLLQSQKAKKEKWTFISSLTTLIIQVFLKKIKIEDFSKGSKQFKSKYILLRVLG